MDNAHITCMCIVRNEPYKNRIRTVYRTLFIHMCLVHKELYQELYTEPNLYSQCVWFFVGFLYHLYKLVFMHLQDTTSTRSTRYNIITNTTRKKKWTVPTCTQGLSILRFPCNTTGGCHKAMLYLNRVF